AGSVGIIIMGKTADLTIVQKTIIDTLHKDGKPQQVQIAKQVGCSQSTVSKHTNRKLCGKEKCGRKRCTSSRDDSSLERIVRKRPFKSTGNFHKVWTEVEVSASRATTQRQILDMDFKCHIPLVKTLLNPIAQWSKVIFSDESKFCISFGNQGLRFWGGNREANNAQHLKPTVKFPQSVLIIWRAMSSAGVGPLWLIKPRVNAAVYQEVLKYFILPFTDKLYGDADFIFHQDLAPSHMAKVPKPGSVTLGLLCLIGQQTHQT
ncbi:hypothetical protein JRQ81_014533, partial [Phrynocephalus forsythii]